MKLCTLIKIEENEKFKVLSVSLVPDNHTFGNLEHGYYHLEGYLTIKGLIDGINGASTGGSGST